jgi:hypothetical protein
VSEPTPPIQPAAAAGSQQPNNALGLISLILGIISVVVACCGAGILFGAVAAVLGYLGKQKADKGEATNKGQANAGLILGIIGAAISLIIIIGSVVFSMSNPFMPGH